MPLGNKKGYRGGLAAICGKWAIFIQYGGDCQGRLQPEGGSISQYASKVIKGKELDVDNGGLEQRLARTRQSNREVVVGECNGQLMWKSPQMDAWTPIRDTKQPGDGGVTQAHTETREPPQRRRRTSATQSTHGSVGASRSTSPSHLSATPPSAAAGSQPPYRMCIGESQVTCDIDAEGRIVPIGGSRLFHLRIGSLLETYMSRLHDQLELDKKFVLNHLEREFGTGRSHKRML
ncbi:hypothetical protein L7F22_036324 [Adiantum nelumboides]|nr:hypothetical protein [Adiantum nelumboides]